MRLAAGTRLGPYEIVGALGSGGMGEVYRARDPRLRRDVAVKVLRAASVDGPAWERFRREAHVASSLSHPNICAIYDVGDAEGQPYLVMELLDGISLGDRIGATPLGSETTVALGIQIAAALAAAHAKGIVHRDIKPANVMLTAHDHVKVLDFGVAKLAMASGSDDVATVPPLTQAGTLVGTTPYLSPEVLRGGEADARSDLWAFGVVLYQMLSGRLPFNGSTAYETSAAILSDALPALPASTPPALRAIVERCLEKRPERRYQHAGEIGAALKAVRLEAARPLGARRPAWILAAGVLLLLVTGVLGVAVWPRPRDTSVATVSSGAPASNNREANELFELAMNIQRVQNDIPRAQDIYERALALDPHFAEARRYHALNYVILLLNGYTGDVGVLYKAEEELRQVSQEAPDLFSLPSAQTAVYLAQGRKELVPLARLEEVSRQHPAHVDSGIWRFILHLLNEENAQAKVVALDALTRQPLLGAMRGLLGELLRTEGDAAGAIREQLKVLEQAPGNITAMQFLVRAYIDNGEIDKARQLLEEKRPQFAGNYLWRHTWALCLAAEGRRAEALQAMDQDTLRFASAVFLSTLQTADFYALLDDRPAAIDWLERAVRNGDERTRWFRRNPNFARLQQDPGFLRIVSAIDARRSRP